MREALDEFNSGNYPKCIQLLTDEIENNKQYILEATNLRGSLFMLKCQYKQAKQDFDLILNNPDASNRLKSNTYIKLTALNLQNGQEDDAFINYDKAIEIDSLNEDIYCNRAQVYAMKGKFEECFADFDKCLEINPDNKIARIQKSFFQFRQFYAQFSLYAQSVNSPDNLKQFYENSNELKTETAKLESLLEKYNDIPEAYNLYAQILSEQENYEKAEKYYQFSLEKDPSNAALMVQRVIILLIFLFI
jgi:import receptor subunit TOM70